MRGASYQHALTMKTSSLRNGHDISIRLLSQVQLFDEVS